MIKRQINPKLEMEGIFLTMVDSRTNYAKDISSMRKASAYYSLTEEVLAMDELKLNI